MWKSAPLSRTSPSVVPSGKRVYAVGDVHGRADLLRLLLLQIELDRAIYPIAEPITVFLGDYIDRGPASKEVLELLVTQQASEQKSIFLKGNHECFPASFLKEPSVLASWRKCGGLETLLAYGLTPSFNPDQSEQLQLAREFDRALPASHRRFLETLELWFVCGDFVFVHAGVRPGVSLQRQTEEDLLWIRSEFLQWDGKFEKMVVHGHSPVRLPDFRSNRINIDTGAFATGLLTCMVFEADGVMPLVDVRVWASRVTGRPASEVLASKKTEVDIRSQLAAFARSRDHGLADRANEDASARELRERVDPRLISPHDR
jgi:serine/threonine protein phosphatase 1